LLRNDPGGNREEAAQILQEAERASAILRQLLVTARESRPGRSKVALNEVISRTMELLKFSLTAERVHVELALDSNIPLVHGDAGQLQQVLMNLVGNARQAIEQQARGGTIRLSTRHLDRRRVLLEVSDDGPGIPEAIRARIFDPFFTTKPAGVGTGLGLAIVLGIVREHGGQVYARSPKGQGATFSIHLPASAERPGLPESFPPQELKGRAQSAESTEIRSGASAGNGKVRAKRVLVIEDEPTVTQLIADVLKEEGFQVSTAMTGREAQNRASESFDLVVCDMKMPGFDGAQFYRGLVRSGN